MGDTKPGAFPRQTGRTSAFSNRPDNRIYWSVLTLTNPTGNCESCGLPAVAAVRESGKRADTTLSNQQLTDADFEGLPFSREMAISGTSRTRLGAEIGGKGSSN